MRILVRLFWGLPTALAVLVTLLVFASPAQAGDLGSVTVEIGKEADGSRGCNDVNPDPPNPTATVVINGETSITVEITMSPQTVVAPIPHDVGPAAYLAVTCSLYPSVGSMQVISLDPDEDENETCDDNEPLGPPYHAAFHNSHFAHCIRWISNNPPTFAAASVDAVGGRFADVLFPDDQVVAAPVEVVDTGVGLEPAELAGLVRISTSSPWFGLQLLGAGVVAAGLATFAYRRRFATG